MHLRANIIRFVAIAVTACAVLFVVPFSAAGAADDDPPPVDPPDEPAEPVDVCATPPEETTTTTEECEAFVDLWTPRFEDEAFLADFVALEEVPQAILDEGYHALDTATQTWLIDALAEHLITIRGADGDNPGVRPPDEEVAKSKSIMFLMVFGKDQLNGIIGLDDENPEPAPQDGPSTLAPIADSLANTPTAAETLEPSPFSPGAPVVDQVDAVVEPSPALEALTAPATPPAVVDSPLDTPVVSAQTEVLDPDDLVDIVLGAMAPLPGATDLDVIVDQLLTAIGQIQQQLFTLPVLNLVGGLTYRVCAESPTQPLACSINLPVGVPIPSDVNGDVVPDVIATLLPVIGVPTIEIVSVFPLVINVNPVPDAGFQLDIQRLFPSSGPLPAHVFVVYDPPTTDKRVELGFDGRADTLAFKTRATATVKDIFAAATGDVELEAQITHSAPGSSEILTAAIKELVPQTNALPLERDPVVAAIDFSPVPEELTVNAHLQHFDGKNQDTISIDSDVATTVTGRLTQEVNTVSPPSRRDFDILVDQLPRQVSVDLLSQGGQQVITYEADSVIDNIHVTQTSVDDTADPGSYTSNDIDVVELPEDVQVTLTGSEDILYSGSSVVPQIEFVTETAESGELQNQIVAAVHGIPENVHLSLDTESDTSAIGYEADSSLESLAIGMYDKAADETIVQATAEDFPLEMDLLQTKSTGVTDYSASGPIGRIEATIARNGGAFIPLAGDHATVKVATDGGGDEQLGVHLALSGLAGAHIDPSEEASYGLQLSPGGQPFEAIAELDDPNRAAHVTVSNLPSSIQLDLDPEDGIATYTASAVIDEIDARYDQLDDGLIGRVVLTDIPTSIAATFETSGSTPDITYDANGNLGSLSAFYQEAPGATTFDALVVDLPRFMSISGVEEIVFDARTGPTAPEASDDVGAIRLRYGSDGVLPATGNPSSHLYLDNDGVDTNAELLYTGLELMSVAVEDDDMRIRVENSEPRHFDVDVTTPEMDLSAFVEKIPDSVEVQMQDQFISYEASAPITEIAASVDRLNGDVINADLVGLPREILLEFDTDESTIDWTADAETLGVLVDAQLGPDTTGTDRTFNAQLGILDIPAEWTGSFDEGHVLFDGITSPIGQITAAVTNHGIFNTVGGDGVSAVFDEPAGDLDAYLRITDLDRAEFQKVAAVGDGAGGFDANLDMGNGAPFNINADLLTADGTVLTAAGSISDLPSEMHVRAVDDLITYEGDDNPTLDLEVAYGQAAAVAATPAPPVVHGVAARDGSSGADNALKANLFITGLPDELRFDTSAGTYEVNGFDPDVDPLTLDVALDDFVTTPVALLVQQTVGAGPVDFTFGPFTSGTANDGSKTIHAEYAASRQMGKLTGDVTMGLDTAHLLVSNIPTSLTFDASFGDPNKSITIGLGQPVDEITAGYKGSFAGDFTAGVTLTDVPTSVNLLLGEQGDAAGVMTPQFSYNASAATLDIEAFLDDAVFGPASDAGFQLDVENLGTTVAANLSGTTLNIGSTPPTESFTLVAHAALHFDFDLGFSAGPLNHTGSAGIDLDVQELTIGFTDLTSLELKLGYSTGIAGDYGTFTFGERSETVVDVVSDLDIEFSFLGIDIDEGIYHFETTVNLGNVIGNFRLADDHLGDWIDITLPVPCLDPLPGLVSIQVLLRPHPHSTSNGATFTVNGGGPAWVATVNPLGVLPNRVTDIIARFTTPYTGDQGLDADCD